MTREDISCKDTRLLMIDELTGQIAAEDRQQLERHLVSCAACGEHWASLRQMWKRLGNVPTEPISEDSRRHLMELVRQEQASPANSSGERAAQGLENRELAEQGQLPHHNSDQAPVEVGSGRQLWSLSSLWLLSRAAILLLVFIGGLVVGRLLLVGVEAEPVAGPAGEEYMLLLHENERFFGPPVEQAVEEYRNWGRDLADDGLLVTAEKLADDRGIWLIPAEGEDFDVVPVGAAGSAETSQEARAGRPTGFYIIRASGLDDARRVASTIPHLKYGGAVQLLEIDQLD